MAGVSLVCENRDRYVVYLKNKHTKGICVARLGNLRLGQSERFRVHQLWSPTTRELTGVLRPNVWVGLPVNEGRTQASYARFTLGIDQHIRLREYECEYVMGSGKGITTHNL